MSDKNDKLARRLAESYNRYIRLYSQYGLVNMICYVGLVILLLIALLCMFLKITGNISGTACVVWLVVMGALLVADGFACRITADKSVLYIGKANICADDLSKLYGQEAANVLIAEAEALVEEKRERRSRAVHFFADNLHGKMVNIVVAPGGGVHVCDDEIDKNKKGLFGKTHEENVEDIVESIENNEDNT